MRLIDADALKETIKKDMYIVDYAVDGAIYGMFWNGIENAIDEQSSVEPKIIRCSECKYSKHWYGDKSRCFLWHPDGIDVFNDGFCNYGRRDCDKAVTLEVVQPEIIYCKDCKHMIINEKHEAKPMICCFTKMCGTTEPDWFCADGERRDDERLNQ